MRRVMKRPLGYGLAVCVCVMAGHAAARPITAEEPEETRPDSRVEIAPVLSEPDVAATYVVIVSGINKDPEERQAKDRAVLRLQRFLIGDEIAFEERVRVLVAENSLVRDPSGPSTADNIRRTLAEVAAELHREDRFVFYYTGQANIVAGTLRLNVPGPDFTQDELAEWIGAVKAATTVVILDCPGGGLAVKPLSENGAIVICGARSDQVYSPRFSKYFIPALTDPASDADNDGRISLLEAFQQTAAQVDAFYRERDLLKTETPILEDNGDGVPSQRPWQYSTPDEDGWNAARFFLEAPKRES